MARVAHMVQAKARSSHVETAELQDLVEDYKQMAAGVRTEVRCLCCTHDCLCCLADMEHG